MYICDSMNKLFLGISIR